MAARCARIRISWALLSGAETADIGFYFLSPTGTAITALKTGHDASITTFWSAIAAMYKPTTQMVKARIDEIDINTGHVISGVDGALPAAPAGTVNAAQLPLQCSSVVTLRTALSGASFRGRVYMPPMVTTTIDTNGYLGPPQPVTLASAVANYLHGVNAGSVTWEACVYSRKNSSMSVITSVDVGTVIDTQRNRRSDLIETRSSAAV